MGKRVNPNPRLMPPPTRTVARHRMPLAGDILLVSYAGFAARVTRVTEAGFFAVPQIKRTSQLAAFEDATDHEGIARARWYEFKNALELLQSSAV